MRMTSLAWGTLAAVAAFSAQAGETTFTYTGQVSKVFAATYGEQGPADIQVGTPVSFSVTYDPSRLVSFTLTAPLHDAATGAPITVFPKAVLLGNDPAADYSVTIASHTWTLADDISDGYITPSGIGPYPFLAYEGRPSQIIGITNDAVVNDLEFYSEPADFLLEGARHEAYGDFLTADSDYGFAVDTSLHDAIVNIRQQELAIAAIPEPSSWALLVLGFAGLRACQWRRPKRLASQVDRAA